MLLPSLRVDPVLSSMSDSFGARLRARREEQAIALVTIAEQTKIKLSLLEALERDDVSRWPSGIFRRAFIRAYADALGLDPDAVVREFLEVHPEPAEMVEAALARAAGTDWAPNTGPPTRLREIVGSAIDAFARFRRGPGAQGPALPAEAPVNAVALDPGTPRPLTTTQRETGPPEWTPEVIAGDVPDMPSASSGLEHVALAQTPAAPDAPSEVDRAALPPSPAADGVPQASSVIPDAAPTDAPPPMPDGDLLTVAHLCTEFARAENANELRGVLQEVARVLDASGLIVWVWDSQASGLRPALVHGYSQKVIAQLPTVERDADNATAAGFRTGQVLAIPGNDHASGALVIPLLTPDGCAGVLAIELRHGGRQTSWTRAVATIFGAMFSQLLSEPRPDEVRPPTPVTGSPTRRRH
jgi:hypothetical protein